MTADHENDLDPKKETGVSRAQLSRILGVNVRTIFKLEADGIFTPSERGRGGKGSVFVLEEVVPKYIRYCSGVKPNEDKARDRRDKSQAELNELLLAQKRRELLPRENVVAEAAAHIARVMAKLRALASRAVQEGVIPPDSRVKLEAMLEEAISEFRSWETPMESVAAFEEIVAFVREKLRAA